MSRIFSITKKIKVEKSYEFTDKIPVIKEVDIEFLKAANQFVVGEFKNSDIRAHISQIKTITFYLFKP